MYFAQLCVQLHLVSLAAWLPAAVAYFACSRVCQQLCPPPCIEVIEATFQGSSWDALLVSGPVEKHHWQQAEKSPSKKFLVLTAAKPCFAARLQRKAQSMAPPPAEKVWARTKCGDPPGEATAQVLLVQVCPTLAWGLAWLVLPSLLSVHARNLLWRSRGGPAAEGENQLSHNLIKKCHPGIELDGIQDSFSYCCCA